MSPLGQSRTRHAGMERPCYVPTRAEQDTTCGHGEARFNMSSLGQSRARNAGMERPAYVLTRAEQDTTCGHGEVMLCPP